MLSMQLPNKMGVQILDVHKYFDGISETILVAASHAIDAVRVLLPVEGVDIVFQHAPQGAMDHLVFGGYTPDAHTIYISVDTARPDIKEIIEHELAHTIAHELHHAMRWRSVGYGDTLAEALVTEGLADRFSVEATGGEPSLWTQGFSNEELEALLVRARAEFDKTDYSHEDWFFGGNGLPKWGGYALGYFIVGKYLAEHPGVTAASLCDVEASEILK